MSTRKKSSRPPWFNPAHDVVLHAWADDGAGRKWLAEVVWVLVRDRRDGTTRVEALQPDEWSYPGAGVVIGTLYAISQNCHGQMTSAVKALVGDKHS